MITSTQITNTEIFAFLADLVFNLLRLNNRNCRLLFRKLVNFTGELLQNYKWLECEIFRILLKHVSDHLSVLFHFA